MMCWDNLARLACGDEYAGVYSSDKIPARRLAKKPRFIVIVNLGSSRNPNGHFVTLVGRPSTVLYLDPYGLPSVVESVNKFLEACGRKVENDFGQVQRFSSKYCGLYALLFAAYHSRKKPPQELVFDGDDLEKNDRLCMKYLSLLSVYNGDDGH